MDSTLLEVLHPRQVAQSAGFDGAGWVRWGSFAVYGVKLHLLCATNRVPLSYELTAANVADALLVRELVDAAGLGESDLARRLLGGPGLPQRRTGRRAGPGRHPARDRKGASAPTRPPAGGGVLRGPQARLRYGRDAREDARGLGHQDSGEGGGLHLRLLHQQVARSHSRAHQGAVGIKTSQQTSSPDYS